MTDFIPSMAPISALFFLETGFVLVICVPIPAYAAIRRSNRLLAIAGGGGIFVIAEYVRVFVEIFTDESRNGFTPRPKNVLANLIAIFLIPWSAFGRSAMLGEKPSKIRATENLLSWN